MLEKEEETDAVPTSPMAHNATDNQAQGDPNASHMGKRGHEETWNGVSTANLEAPTRSPSIVCSHNLTEPPFQNQTQQDPTTTSENKTITIRYASSSSYDHSASLLENEQQVVQWTDPIPEDTLHVSFRANAVISA